MGSSSLYAAEQQAKAKRITAEAEAYATEVIATAIAKNGLEAVQYQVALKQVEALTEVGKGPGKQVVLLPAAALDAFKAHPSYEASIAAVRPLRELRMAADVTARGERQSS